jgi:hypothetical protein
MIPHSKGALVLPYEEGFVSFGHDSAHDADFLLIFSHFQEKWKRFHVESLAVLERQSAASLQVAADEEDPLEENLGLLLKRRKALFSSVVQRLAIRNLSPEAKALEKRSVAQWIAQHDEKFQVILQSEMQRLRGELARTFEARRALGAYAQTMQA